LALISTNITMSRFTFDLATPADDASLRELLAATPMAGRMSIAFAREPSYFDAAVVDGNIVQVGVARNRDSGRIIGMGSRAVSTRYVNGRPSPVGYLSGLRLLPEYRGHAALLARGYRFFRELHNDQAAPYYLTTIAADNDAATNVLASGRAGLPIYHPLGSYCTLSLATTAVSTKALPNRDNLSTRTATAADRDAIIQFLLEHGPVYSYFPEYSVEDLFTNAGLLRGLAGDDVLLALRDNTIVGTLAGWNQRAFKQIIIHSYSGWLRPLRPLYNVLARLRHQPTLPPVGSVLNACLAAIPVVRSDDHCVFQTLLITLLRRLAEYGQPLLLLGLHERHPLLPIARQFSGKEYRTNLFIVHWPDETLDIESLTHRVPYLELGSL
jgi:hypothetical protein